MKKTVEAALFLLCALCLACTTESSISDGGLSDAGLPDGGCSQQPYCTTDSDRILHKCEGGALVKIDCMAQYGMLCQGGACIEPAKYGNPVWSTCPNVVGGTTETLKAKAETFDRVMRNIHLNAVSHITHRITLKDGSDIRTAAGPDDVQTWHTDENDGLWSGHYLAAEAFRYAVTKSPEALENVKALIQGHKDLSYVTGKPGLPSRQFVPADTRGMTCPDESYVDYYAYYPDATEKYGNKWRKVDSDGCLKVYDKTKSAWVKLTYCVDKKYAGYCFMDNVSQDSIIGTIYGFAIVGKLVDDPDVRAAAADLIGKSIKNMIQDGMRYIDWDGLVTTFGRIYPSALQDFPGFSAIMAMSYVKTAAVLTGDSYFSNIYETCLVKGKSGGICSGLPPDGSYLDYWPGNGLYNAKDSAGCKNNYNNFNMTFMGLHPLIWFEHDAKTREYMQEQLEGNIMGVGSARDMWDQKDSFFNFIYAADKKLGLNSSGPAYQMVEDAVCSLRQFPTSKAYYTHVDNSTKYPFDCVGRLDNSRNTNVPIPVNERDLWIFTWSADPYQLKSFGPEIKTIDIAADYLLPYWMGRYYGFIKEEQ